jgi:predicted nucleic acid-binding protein
VNRFVIDASVAIKWVVEENGTEEALILRRSAKLIAPELLATECANILWKKVRRREFSPNEASLAARLLQTSEVELLSTRLLMERTVRIALELNHPAYDCLYLALAAASAVPLVTADSRLRRKLSGSGGEAFGGVAITLHEAVADRLHPGS